MQAAWTPVHDAMTQPTHHSSSLGPKGDKRSLPGAQGHPLHVQPASRSFPAIPQSDVTRASECQPEHRSLRDAQLEYREVNFQMTCKTGTERVFSFPFKLLKIGIRSLYNAVLVLLYSDILLLR